MLPDPMNTKDLLVIDKWVWKYKIIWFSGMSLGESWVCHFATATKSCNKDLDQHIQHRSISPQGLTVWRYDALRVLRPSWYRNIIWLPAENFMLMFCFLHKTQAQIYEERARQRRRSTCGASIKFAILDVDAT